MSLKTKLSELWDAFVVEFKKELPPYEPLDTFVAEKTIDLVNWVDWDDRSESTKKEYETTYDRYDEKYGLHAKKDVDSTKE